MRLSPLALLGALLGGCDPTVTFAIDGRSASVPAEKTDQAIEYASPDDARTTVRGPHAVGSRVPVVAARVLGPIDLWQVEVGPAEQATLGRRFDAGNEMRLSVDLIAEGTSEVDVIDTSGDVAGTLELEARPVAGASLLAFDDIVIGAREIEPIAPDGVIRLVEGFEASLVVVWLDADGVPLTGNGLLSVELVDPLNSLRLVAIRGTDVPGLDSVQIRAERVTGDSLAELRVSAADVPIASWQVEVLDPSELSDVSLVEIEDYGFGGRVGFVHAIARDGFGHRIVGPELDWTNNSEPLFGTGSYVALIDGCDSFVEACSPVTDLCVGTNVHAEARLVGKGVARPPIECSHGGAPPALGSALLALAALIARRRRRIVAAALGAAIAVASAHAYAQAPSPDPDGTLLPVETPPPLTAPQPVATPQPVGTPPPQPIPVPVEPSDEPLPVLVPVPVAEPIPVPVPATVPVQRAIIIEPTASPDHELVSDFQVRPTIAWGLHTPVNSLTPVRSNFVLGLSARYGFQRHIGLEGIQLAGGGLVSFTGMFGNVRSGWELRATSLIGPQFVRGRRDYKVSLTPLTGLETIVDRYRYYCRPYGTALMISIPMIVRVRLAVFTLEGGVAPSWFLSAQVRQKVDWKVQDIKGFGDEFEFRGAAAVQINQGSLGFNVRTRVASYGDESWVGLGLAYGAYF